MARAGKAWIRVIERWIASAPLLLAMMPNARARRIYAAISSGCFAALRVRRSNSAGRVAATAVSVKANLSPDRARSRSLIARFFAGHVKMLHLLHDNVLLQDNIFQAGAGSDHLLLIGRASTVSSVVERSSPLDI
jgi:hypothetical protein